VGTYCYVAVCRRGGRLGGVRRFGAHRGRRGAGDSVAFSLFYKMLYLDVLMQERNDESII